MEFFSARLVSAGCCSEGDICLQALHKTWSEAIKIYHVVLKNDDIPLDHVIEELTIFLGVYVVTGVLESFVEKKWTKLWLQRTSHKLDAALHTMNDFINDRLRVHLQKALVLVDELCGMADAQAILGEHPFGLAVPFAYCWGF